MSVKRIQEIDAAYAYCIDHDRWPDGFNPFDAIRDLLRECRGYTRALGAHHEISTLSDDVIARGLGAECPVCADARLWRPLSGEE